MLKAQQVADYFIASSDNDDVKDQMSIFRLNKLMYAAQGEFLANEDRPLFTDSKIEIWIHGPVVISLWEKYKEYKFMPLPKPVGVDFSCYGAETIGFLDGIFLRYGQYSDWKLLEVLELEALGCKYNYNRKKTDRTISMQEIKDNFENIGIRHIYHFGSCPRG